MTTTYILLRKILRDRTELPLMAFSSRERAEEVLAEFVGLLRTRSDEARRMQNAGIPPSPTAPGLTKAESEARKAPYEAWWETYHKLWSDADRGARALGEPALLADEYRMVEVPLHDLPSSPRT